MDKVKDYKLSREIYQMKNIYVVIFYERKFCDKYGIETSLSFLMKFYEFPTLHFLIKRI